MYNPRAIHRFRIQSTQKQVMHRCGYYTDFKNINCSKLEAFCCGFIIVLKPFYQHLHMLKFDMVLIGQAKNDEFGLRIIYRCGLYIWFLKIVLDFQPYNPTFFRVKYIIITKHIFIWWIIINLLCLMLRRCYCISLFYKKYSKWWYTNLLVSQIHIGNRRSRLVAPRN